MDNKKITIDLVLFFYKKGCNYCKPFLPMVEKLKQSGIMKIQAILGDENKKIAKKYNIKYYPTIVFIEKENGNVRKLIGKSKMEKFFNTFFKSKSDE
jgi:thiol-disulfide isomerase/thioredoxin